MYGIEDMRYSVDDNFVPFEFDSKCFSSLKVSVPHRFPMYCEISRLIQDELGFIPERVIEFGSGNGFLGIALHQLGSKSLTIVDLPSVCVVIGYILFKCIGEENVWLFGENEAMAKHGSVIIFPSTNCFGAKYFKCDAACTVNSFPEFDVESQNYYLNLIKKH